MGLLHTYLGRPMGNPMSWLWDVPWQPMGSPTGNPIGYPVARSIHTGGRTEFSWRTQQITVP